MPRNPLQLSSAKAPTPAPASETRGRVSPMAHGMFDVDHEMWQTKHINGLESQVAWLKMRIEDLERKYEEVDAFEEPVLPDDPDLVEIKLDS